MYILFTDTDVDLTPQEAKHYGYKMISMPYIIDNKEIKPYEDFEEFDYKSFYDVLRGGVLPKTCAINSEEYKRYFEPYLKAGKDILYVHFSKAMSGTFNAMNIAIEELKEQYPNQTIYTIDTKGITICSNNIVKEIGDMYLDGKSIDEIIKWANKEVDHFATYFYADTLDFFRLSGRVSNFSAIMGNLFGVHPIITMNEEGKMFSVNKCKGKTKSLQKLVDYVEELGEDIDKHRIIVGHADALELAKKLATMLEERFNKKLPIEYVVVNPTAGSHCGPDTVGVCFYAKHR